MEFNAKEVKDQVVRWIRDWFEINGKGCNAVLGISGGKDSSVAAALCAEALGKDRVIGVTMPNSVQPDRASGNPELQREHRRLFRRPHGRGRVRPGA